MKKQAIILHEEELDASGLEIYAVSEAGFAGSVPHRDDHYMFVVQEQGFFLWEVDFQEITLSGAAVSFIAPGQVHRYIHFESSRGYLVFVDAGLIAKNQREIFDTYIHVNQIADVSTGHPVFSIVPMLAELLAQNALPLQQNLLRSLIGTLTGYIASRIIQAQVLTVPVGGQKYHTVARFKQLVAEQYKEQKQVKTYASLLHITPLYLNEIVKQVTGFPASHWINQQVLLEARRMLYYTVLDVKQIAYELGYDDYPYFSRFFKKHTGMTALAFRKTNHISFHQSP